MKTIWKTALDTVSFQEISLPENAEILHVGEQFNKVCLWYRCEPYAEKTARSIAIIGTGHAAPDTDEGRYLGTASLDNGALILHVFIRNDHAGS